MIKFQEAKGGIQLKHIIRSTSSQRAEPVKTKCCPEATTCFINICEDLSFRSN